MKTTVSLVPALFCLLLNAALRADVRTSADYAITAETMDSGGQRTASADGTYANDGSAGGLVGMSGVAGEVARGGFLGQVYELLGYGLLVSDFYPPEEGFTQIIPVRTADDGTNFPIPTTGFHFVPLEGPIPGISETGLVETTSIYENTPAIVGATSPQFPGLLTITFYVQDTIPDNYSTYARDGIPDAWQFRYFGRDNPLGLAAADPDGDGQSNLFEFTAGLDPTDAGSRFHLELLPGLTDGQRQLVFSPRLPDRTYTVEAAANLEGAPFVPLAGTIFTDDGETRTVTDLNATDPARYYRVSISKQ